MVNGFKRMVTLSLMAFHSMIYVYMYNFSSYQVTGVNDTFIFHFQIISSHLSRHTKVDSYLGQNVGALFEECFSTSSFMFFLLILFGYK